MHRAEEEEAAAVFELRRDASDEEEEEEGRNGRRLWGEKGLEGWYAHKRGEGFMECVVILHVLHSIHWVRYQSKSGYSV